MTLSSALARSTWAAGSRIRQVIVGVAVLVFALCYLGHILRTGSAHDAALPNSSMAISAADHADLQAVDPQAVDSEHDDGSEHSCHHERSTAAHPQAPALTTDAKPAVFDKPTSAATDPLSPLVTDHTQLPGPRQHVLCVLRT